MKLIRAVAGSEVVTNNSHYKITVENVNNIILICLVNIFLFDMDDTPNRENTHVLSLNRFDFLGNLNDDKIENRGFSYK